MKPAKEKKQALATTFDAELLRRFRVSCAEKGERMNAVLSRFMRRYIAEKEVHE